MLTETEEYDRSSISLVEREYSAIDPKATIFFFKTLARQIDPVTGISAYSNTSLQGIFRMNREEVARLRQELSVPYINHRRPYSVQPQKPLEEAARSFFVGLALDNFKVAPVSVEGSPYVSIKTESQDPKIRGLLLNTIGRWRAIPDWGREMRELKIYLDSPQFDFLLRSRKAVTTDFLSPKKRFGPFLLGVLASNLSPTNRVSLPDRTLESVYRYYGKHFHHSMGRIEYRGRKDKINPEACQGAIVIKDLQSLMDDLHLVKEVEMLEFGSVLFDRDGSLRFP